MTRDLLHEELERLWLDRKFTCVFVTHNVREAVRLGDRVVMLTSRPGRVAEVYGDATHRAEEHDRDDSPDQRSFLDLAVGDKRYRLRPYERDCRPVRDIRVNKRDARASNLDGPAADIPPHAVGQADEVGHERRRGSRVNLGWRAELLEPA